MVMSIKLKKYLMIAFAGSALLLQPQAHAQHYVPVESGSKIEFSVMNKEVGGTPQKVKGTLNKISGNINFDPKHLDRSSFNITLNAASVNTHDAARDKDLKGFRFFDVLSFPSIRFVSTSVTQDRPGSIVYNVAGNLTIKGVTKPVKLQFTTTRTGKSYLFRGSMTINRLLFNVGEKGDIGEDVTVFIEVHTK